MIKRSEKPPSLENLIESEETGLNILHPGGLGITRELAQLCNISKGSKVLEIASGLGESACFLVENFECELIGIDASDYMIERARLNARERNLVINFIRGDAHNLPFEKDNFDLSISECTTCILDKESAIREMVRVTRLGGYVGIHDLCWKEDTPQSFKQRLAEIEGERPETLDGWKNLFEKAGLEEVKIVDKSYLLPEWGKDIKKRLGMVGQFKILLKILKNWGFRGYKTIAESERIFTSKYTGYGIIVGKKARSFGA